MTSQALFRERDFFLALRQEVEQDRQRLASAEAREVFDRLAASLDDVLGQMEGKVFAKSKRVGCLVLLVGLAGAVALALYLFY